MNRSMTGRGARARARARSRSDSRQQAFRCPGLVLATAVAAACLGLPAGAAPIPPTTDRAAAAAPGGFGIVHAFTGVDGATPYTSLVPGPDGALYGTTWNYGGTIFRLDARGHLGTYLDFGYRTPSGPVGPVVVGPDGSFYGVTDDGSPVLRGSVYRVTPSRELQVLHVFEANADAGGSNPSPGLVLGPDGALYGTASAGGPGGNGIVFRLTTDGAFTIVHAFVGVDGGAPRSRLALGPDGLFYGTTSYGGRHGQGTVFRMDLAGQVTVLHSFAGAPADGGGALAPPLLGRDGALYGTTTYGGANNLGTVWRLDPLGRMRLLHSFAADGHDGDQPWSGLIQTRDGRFVGMTAMGGALPSACDGGWGCGTVFEVTTGGSYRVIHTFTTGRGGQYPLESLREAADGSLLGTTYGDAGLSADRMGSVFRLLRDPT